MKHVREHHAPDLVLLELVLLDVDNLTFDEVNAFMSMRNRLARFRDNKLTDKQRSWLEDVAKRLDIAEPSANLVSSGEVPRGAEVPIPEILKHRPLKPPGR